MNLLSYIQSPSPITLYKHDDWEFYIKHDEDSTAVTSFDTIKTRGLLQYGHDHHWTHGARGNKIAVYNSQVSTVGVNLSAIAALTGNKIRVYHRACCRVPGSEQIMIDGGDLVGLPLPDNVVGKEAWIQAKHQALLDQYDMLPYGMAYLPAVNNTAYECLKAMQTVTINSIVVAVGSGATLAGILKGLTLAERQHTTKIYAVVVGDFGGVKDTIKTFIASPLDTYDISWVVCSLPYNQRVEYSDMPIHKILEWRCDPYYDRKAFLWLLNWGKEGFFIDGLLPRPILFWNCG